MSASAGTDQDPSDDGLDEDVPETGNHATVAPPLSARLALPPEAAGQRLDVWLTAQSPDYSRVQVKRMIEAGLVRWSIPPRNGAKLKVSYLIQGGEELLVQAPAPRPQVVAGEAIPLELLHEDADIAVVNKPAGLVVHPGAGTPSGTLANALVGRYGALAGAEADRPGIVHRLDKETSGVIVVARNEKALRNLMAQFEARTVRKLYLALVHGTPGAEFTVEAPIGRHSTQRALMAIQPPGQGRGSVTQFQTLVQFSPASGSTATGHAKKAGESFALVACFPKTGRTHQLRVHLKSVDHPILADGMYGRESRYPAESAKDGRSGRPPLIDRQALHAFAIAFDHPSTGQRLCLTAPLPSDMTAVLASWSATGSSSSDWNAAIAATAKAFCM